MKQSETTTRSKTPLEPCKGCKHYQGGTGCGWLDSLIGRKGTTKPCGHPVEKHRFDHEPVMAPA